MYHLRNTHWSRAGNEVAAVELAAALDRLWFAGGDEPAPTVAVDRTIVAAVRRAIGAVERVGPLGRELEDRRLRGRPHLLAWLEGRGLQRDEAIVGVLAEGVATDDGTRFAGWVVDPRSPGRAFEVLVFVDGRLAGAGVTGYQALPTTRSQIQARGYALPEDAPIRFVLESAVGCVGAVDAESVWVVAADLAGGGYTLLPWLRSLQCLDHRSARPDAAPEPASGGAEHLAGPPSNLVP